MQCQGFEGRAQWTHPAGNEGLSGAVWSSQPYNSFLEPFS